MLKIDFCRISLTGNYFEYVFEYDMIRNASWDLMRYRGTSEVRD